MGALTVRLRQALARKATIRLRPPQAAAAAGRCGEKQPPLPSPRTPLGWSRCCRTVSESRTWPPASARVRFRIRFDEAYGGVHRFPGKRRAVKRQHHHPIDLALDGFFQRAHEFGRLGGLPPKKMPCDPSSCAPVERVPGLNLRRTGGVRRVLVEAGVDADAIERRHDGVVGEVEDAEAEGPKLSQGPVREVAGQDDPDEGGVMLVRHNKRKDRSLYFLRLVAGMLGVSAPGRFDERHGRTDPGVAPVPLQHEVQVMGVPIQVHPADFVPFPGRSRPLLVQVKAVFGRNVPHQRFDGDFQELLADDLAPAVRRRGRHALTPAPKAGLRGAEPGASGSSTSGFCLASFQTRRT